MTCKAINNPRCYRCEKPYKEHTGPLTLSGKKYTEVLDVLYYRCSGCGGLLLPRDTVLAIEQAEADRQMEPGD